MECCFSNIFKKDFSKHTAAGKKGTGYRRPAACLLQRQKQPQKGKRLFLFERD